MCICSKMPASFCDPKCSAECLSTLNVGLGSRTQNTQFRFQTVLICIYFLDILTKLPADNSLPALQCLTVFISLFNCAFRNPTVLVPSHSSVFAPAASGTFFYTEISFKPTALRRLGTILQAWLGEPYSCWQPNRPAFSPERRMELNREWTRENTRLKFPLMSRNMTGMH